MTHKKIIKVTKESAKYIEKLLHTIPTNGDTCFSSNDSFTISARFDNSYIAEVRIQGVEFEDNSSNTPLSEVVLFNNLGEEVSYIDGCGQFWGDWELEDDNNDYYQIAVTA